MITFINHPPQASADARFTLETLHKLSERGGDKKEIKKIGKRAGGFIIANVQGQNIGTATEILFGMIDSDNVSPFLDSWGDVENFMAGAMNGMLHEIESDKARQADEQL